ncbi:A-kinase anchor protein 12-like isoform X2 [Myxocyprinus asiaticus]|uniref:A-kinase anchor protein 12-like isoform X2 n=1 Tax=Myxocyprinus asiaticus TaxID=70543 RepID=UPI002222D5C7|nr:A-kinase anchor protein 12-like isoform X2 [Myxocyprinus asiaticus]
MLGTITLTVGQTDAISQKEDNPETIEVHQEEVAPQVNGEKGDDSANADEITTTEEKVVEEKQEEANEVGFKKIFRFVGFKFTLKKDTNEKVEPVQLLTVKEAENGASDAATEENKEKPATKESKSEEEKSAETTENEKESMTEDATDKAEEPTDQPEVNAPAESEKSSDEMPEKSAEETGTTLEKEPEPEVPTESSTSPPSQETQSPFRRFFTQGIFSNLRKKTSFKKSKDEEQVKEESAEEDIKNAEVTAADAVESTEEAKVHAEKGPAETEQIEKPTETVETEADTAEITSNDTEEQKDLKIEAEATSVAETVTQTETAEAPVSETSDDAQPSDDAKPANDKSDVSEEVKTEAEILSSQEKAKAQGSPLKKLFTGAGLKKLSSKKQKSKKEAGSKQTESGEQAAEQIQQSTESTEPQKPDSGESSPDESAEHVVVEVTQAEVAQAVESEGEPATSDSEKKKDGILPWSSFKKLVTPKKRVKRPSESEDEAPGDKPKSSTLSSTESAVFDEKTDETKPSEDVPSESKEESQAESKDEPKAEKTEPVAEEPKRKIDTSVSWEALICVGSAKKRTRKTSDSDDEEPKIEEEVQQSGEEQAKTAESPLVSSGEADHENLASSPEPEEELVSTWESFKRLVTQRKKPKAEDKSDEASGPEQTTSDSEIPKEESSFSLRKLIPRRKKKSDGKQVSLDVGSAEDDSDTPAVVPLSEYDNETSAEVVVKAEEIKQEVAPVTQAQASAEDRSPSWISTTVENIEDETEGKQLCDIPEEGDTAATCKSTDNTIAEDIVKLTSEAVTALEQAETEMVSAIIHITASPVTSGETTPVSGDSVEKTDVVLQEDAETISVTTSAMDITMTETEEKNFDITTDVYQVESAIKEEKTVLVAYEKTEATAICTGLGTHEIQAVEEESLLKPSVESVTAVSQALVTGLVVEGKTEKPEMASVTEDKVHEAQVSEVQTELKEELQSPLENAVEEKPLQGVPAAEAAESKEDPIPVVTPTEEFAVVRETVCVISSTSESTDSQTAELAHEAAMEKVPLVLPTGDHKIQVKVNDVEVVTSQRFVEGNFEVTSTNVSVLVEEVCENLKEVEMIKVDQVREAEIIKKQSSVIVQEVIQHVVENLAEAHEEQSISEKASEEVSFKLEETLAASEIIEEKPSTEVVLDEKLPSDTIPEKPNTSDTLCEDGGEQTCIITQKPTVNEAILIAEKVPVSITAQSEEVATVSVTAVQQETELTKSEVELKQAEEKTVEDKEESNETTESEDGKSQVQIDLKKVPTEIQKDTTESSATQEEKCQSIDTSAHQHQVLAEQCQMVQEVQIEMARDLNVGVVNVINADDVPETNMKDDNSEGQKSVEDMPQKDLDEPEMEVSTLDMKNQGESGDADCQKTDVKNLAAKLEITTEKTANTIAVEEVVEEVGNEIGPVSTEVVTVS